MNARTPSERKAYCDGYVVAMKIIRDLLNEAVEKIDSLVAAVEAIREDSQKGGAE